MVAKQPQRMSKRRRRALFEQKCLKMKEEERQKKAAEELKHVNAVAQEIRNRAYRPSKFTVMKFANNFYDNSFSNSQGTFHPNNCTFNPLDKVVELYERLVQAEKDKVTYLEKLLDKK